eukprot:scaffold35192_cov129-Isochrysis_galbana.AAC.1
MISATSLINNNGVPPGGAGGLSSAVVSAAVREGCADCRPTSPTGALRAVRPASVAVRGHERTRHEHLEHTLCPAHRRILSVPPCDAFAVAG